MYLSCVMMLSCLSTCEVKGDHFQTLVVDVEKSLADKPMLG